MGVFHLGQDHPALDRHEVHERCEPAPDVEPGQIWLVECVPAALSAVHAGLLSRANVVLYEPALAAAVADSLPIGVYAEKLQAIAASGPAIAPRALQFAADGWSVVQLIERLASRHRLLRAAAEAPHCPEIGASPLLAIGTIAAGRYRQLRATPHATPHATGAVLATAAAELGADELLSLTFTFPGMPGPRPPAPGQAFTANGLAG